MNSKSKNYIKNNFIMENKTKIFIGVLLICLVTFISIFFFLNKKRITNIKSKNSTSFFELGPDLNYARFSTSYKEMSNGNVLIIGGDGGVNVGYSIANKVEIYNKKSNKFEKISDSNYFHKKKTYMFEKNNKIYLLDDNPIEIYDLYSNSFNKTNWCVGADSCSNTRQYVNTTFRAYQNGSNIVIVTLKDLHIYDLLSNKLTKLPNFKFERIGYNIIFSPEKKIIVLGGFDKNKTFVKQVEMYNSKLNKFEEIFTLDNIQKISKVDPHEGAIYFNNDKYIYDNKLNLLKKVVYRHFDKDTNTIILDNRYSLLYKNCSYFYCSMQTQIYDKNNDILIDGPNLLYRPSPNPGIIKLSNNKFLIFHNYDPNRNIPLIETQILTIGG